MPLPNTRLAYLDCYEIFDKALEDTRGVRVKVKDRNEAIRLRMRLQYARRLQRDENCATYEPGDPMFGRSIYDTLMVKLREVEGVSYIYVEKITIPENIEGLGGPMPEEDEETIEEPMEADPVEAPKVEQLRRI
jgi:hypothetical protein